MRKNVDSLKSCNPGKAFNVLKKMGAQPGEWEDLSKFTLPVFENLSSYECADRIAEHFSKISREYPSLDKSKLPKRVTDKLFVPESESKAPTLEEFEVFDKIVKANKPKAGVPGDLSRKLVTEFGPEITTPLTAIFNGIIESAKKDIALWPKSWKLEIGTPIPKVTDPQSLDDLRIIALTPFFSKVFEKFVVEWLMKYISHLLDPKQFGGLKDNSTSHYLIELINFVLYNQDYDLPIGVLLCTVDFSKAFNRQNHMILITKLSDMGVPAWLLNLIMGFLSDRSMVVKYGGISSSSKPLPRGTP